jgi:hypothetical protein
MPAAVRTATTAGVPGAGTDEVQTLTIGGTPDGGTFTITFEGHTTSAITWTAVDATLVAAVDAAMGALPSIGSASNITAAAGTISSGIGTITLTFVAAMGKKAVSLAVANSSLTGTAPTAVITETTPGVDAAGRGDAKGSLRTDITNGVLYINTGTAAAPTWTKVGAQ